ncbi:MAG: helix-turn-helix domain-containing protein, partial [Actinomycetia bacterium]|nr:helix-turn-helix domain-containing protein [Actinomycetes bacterium]
MSTFGDVLRHFRERQALTQDVASGLVSVSRATFTQWETNKHLPSLQRGHDLDLALHADGDLVRALEEARTRSPRAGRSMASRPVEPQGPTLVQVIKRARRALLDQLYFKDGQAVGWRHHLVESEDPPSILSTCYGLGALMLLGGPDAHTPEIVERMLAAGTNKDGTVIGWRARAQREPRIEATSTAVKSLLSAGARLSVDVIVDLFKTQLDQVSRERPFAITIALEPLLRVAPDHEFTVELLSLLLARRWDFDGTLLWTEKRVGRRQPMVEPSVAHTARAVTVLRSAPVELLAEAADASGADLYNEASV